MAALTEFFGAHPALGQALRLALMAAAAFVVVFFLLKLEKKVSDKLREKRSRINLRFVENIARFAIILLAVQWVMMSSPLTQSFGKVLFQGTTVIAAIAGFAAQPVIADMICGLILSATKPFNIGDRIELEDGTAGIVKDISLRHVTLQGIDTVVWLIPNSRLNGMKIANMTTPARSRTLHMRFNVAYGTDVDQAMSVIGGAVKDSPYTIPLKPDGRYGPVYFIEYADSSLVMATTICFQPTTTTEVVKSDVNARVKKALDDHGIEIPYNYVNVVMNGDNGKKAAR